MTLLHRPDPDQLLAGIQAEEPSQGRGKLKIFLGYAAGVGKTYAMLAAAHERKAVGIDLVIGYVETHGRAETDALVGDLEVIPHQHLAYRGLLLPEMDVDAVLARHPQLALVDELAHSNAPGARHAKRYLDVEELLAAGIDVYTTLNIQHLESLNDVVAQITGVVVRETIPDGVLDAAYEIELIDLPPAELIDRLRQGKVYVPQQAVHAIEKFFRQGNLTALRELALRRTAERVDNQMRAYMQTRAIPGPWSAAERLLVCVSPSPLSERLVRAGRRLADELNAAWFAVYVETSNHAHLASSQQDQVTRTLQLAEALGGRSFILPGDRVAETIVAYASQHNVTKLIAGKPLRPRWRDWLQGSLVDQLIRQSGSIDVYVISGAPPEPGNIRFGRQLEIQIVPAYLQSFGLVAAATLLGLLMDPALSLARWQFLRHILATGALPPERIWPHPAVEPTNLVMIYLTVVVIAALSLGRGPAVFASVLSSLAFDFLLVPPYLSFAISDTQYVLTFLGLLSVGLVISSLTARVRDQVEVARQRTAQTLQMYELSRDLAAVTSVEQIVQTVLHHVEQTFGRTAAVLLPKHERLIVGAVSRELLLDENEYAVADWVWRRGEPAGRGTNTLPAAQLRYLPLKTVHSVVGVLGIATSHPERHLAPEQQRLLEAFANQAALAVERARLAEESRQVQVLQTTEKLQTTLLNSISHDLRTPLVSITGALTSLADETTGLRPDDRRSLIENARTEAERLNRLVGNLLDMTRLEAGALKIVRTPSEVQDLIGAALEQLGPRLDNRQINVNLADNLALIAVDFVLIVQLLVNLLDNALKYSPPVAPIDVTARLEHDQLELTVSDRGMGIPPEALPHVFDKFYYVQHPGRTGGAGLGLSICKGIVEAHSGSIAAYNRAGGGASFVVRLPLQTTESEQK